MFTPSAPEKYYFFRLRIAKNMRFSGQIKIILFLNDILRK